VVSQIYKLFLRIVIIIPSGVQISMKAPSNQLIVPIFYKK